VQTSRQHSSTGNLGVTLAPARYNAAPDPPDGFAAITAITAMTKPRGLSR